MVSHAFLAFFALFQSFQAAAKTRRGGDSKEQLGLSQSSPSTTSTEELDQAENRHRGFLKRK